MQCDICSKKKATVHLTEIVDDQMSEMHLCEECARQKSVQMEQQFGLADLLAGLADFGKPTKEEASESVKCSNCGMSYDDFRKFNPGDLTTFNRDLHLLTGISYGGVISRVSSEQK